jgi:hypothetical protein
VEFQGDKTKIVFYYISDARVDFRQLIREYADHFKVRVEMKQIGSRQEAGRVGGIGTCGRELCCASWASSFASVSTSAARYQDVALNPQKLAGQCGKLKCCLNYELKCYMEALSGFPSTSTQLETEQGKAYHTKTDVFRRIMWYTFDKRGNSSSFIPLDANRVKEIIDLNRQGIKVKILDENGGQPQAKDPSTIYQNAVGEDSISRFEEKQRKKRKRGGKGVRNKREALAKQNSKQNEVQPQPEATENKPDREQSHQQNRNRRRGNRTKGSQKQTNEP